MKAYSHKYCVSCGKMNTIDPKRPHKKCKFCGEILWPFPAMSNPVPNKDPDNDGDDDTVPPPTP